jgi:hypothetical protein
LTIDEWGEVAQLAIELHYLRAENARLANLVNNQVEIWKLTERQIGECTQYSERLRLDLTTLDDARKASEKSVTRLRIWSYVGWVALAVGGVVVSSVALSN